MASCLTCWTGLKELETQLDDPMIPCTKLRELTQCVLLLAELQQGMLLNASYMLEPLQWVIDRILAQIEIVLNCEFKPTGNYLCSKLTHFPWWYFIYWNIYNGFKLMLLDYFSMCILISWHYNYCLYIVVTDVFDVLKTSLYKSRYFHIYATIRQHIVCLWA